MTLNLGTPSSQATSENTETEQSVRRALGLNGSTPGSNYRPQGRRPNASDQQKHRFVQDGEVPVVVISGLATKAHGGLNSKSPANRLEIAETALKAERDLRIRAERDLNDTQMMVQDLRTKLGHAVLGHDEARASALQADADQQRLAMLLAAEREVREQAEAKLQEALDERDAVKQKLRELEAQLRKLDMPAKKSAAAIRASTNLPVKQNASVKAPRVKLKEPEPKPVKWWLKSKTSKG